jgi:HEAT repeat protein
MQWITGGREGEIKRLIAQLSDPTKRERAAQDLIHMGAEAATGLSDSLATRDPALRDLISQILVRIGTPAAPSVHKALLTGHPEVRARAAQILGVLQDKGSISALLDALQGEFYTVRVQAALALGQIRDPQAISTLTQALKDREPEVRAAACIALGKFADPRTFEAISNILLTDLQIDARQAAAQALGETKRTEAIPYLMEALRDSYWWYERDQAVNHLLDAIAKMGNAVVPSLIKALSDNEGTVKKYAALLLARLPDLRALEPLSISLYDTHFDVCRASAEALAAIGAPAMPILLDALHHPEAWLRQQAVIGLTKSRSAQVIPELLDSLNDENREVRKQIIQSLGELRDPRALSPLREIASSRTDKEMAALARQALEHMQ